MNQHSNPRNPYVIVTGATGAIGTEICRVLCARGTNIIAACRNEIRGVSLVQSLHNDFPDVDIRVLHLDLASRKSVIEAADTLTGTVISGLINNAGAMCRDYTIAEDGYETTISVNFLGTRLFTQLVMQGMAPGSVIVFTTSITRLLHHNTKWPVNIDRENYSQLGTYGLSKTLITSYAAELASDYNHHGIRVNCADPGVVDSGMITMHRWFDRLADIVFRPLIRSPRIGAIPALRAFEAPTSGHIYCRWARHRISNRM